MISQVKPLLDHLPVRADADELPGDLADVDVDDGPVPLVGGGGFQNAYHQLAGGGTLDHLARLPVVQALLARPLGFMVSSHPQWGQVAPPLCFTPVSVISLPQTEQRPAATPFLAWP